MNLQTITDRDFVDHSNPIRVLKLGGSLLRQSGWPTQLEGWLAEQPGVAVNLLIVGGGEMINAMRELSGVHPLDTAAMHWRCVRLLHATFQIAAELLPSWRQIVTTGEFVQHRGWGDVQGNFLLAVDAFYHPQGELRLPENWDTTTDTIAAALAQLTRATELVLLKSCSVAKQQAWSELASRGVVDRAFPTVAANVPRIRLIQLTTTG